MTRARGTRIIRIALALGLLACAQAALAQAAGPSEAAREVAIRRYAARRAAAHGHDDRVKLLTKGLDLDAGQQAQLRRILALQQEELRQLRSDPAMQATDHVAATRAILERTGDRIRAILNPEQRRKYPAATSPRRTTPRPLDVERRIQLTRSAPGEGLGKAN
jgi:hypothetical protein